jgi:hypothetical protein
MAVLFALLAAAAYGVSDFIGGIASRRAHALTVLLLKERTGRRLAPGATRLNPHRFACHLREIRRVRRITLAEVALIALRPFKQRRDIERGVVDARMQVADFREPGRHGGDGEVVHLDVRQFIPGHRCRYPAEAGCPYRIGRGDRPVPGVLVEVDEDLLPRSSRHHFVVTRSGRRRSTSRAKASAARRTWVKPCSGLIRT